jgi:phosphomannomutase/phosphoglucomutase
MESGCNVLDVGDCTSPTIYFLAAHNSNVDYGIMVTASHNPIDYNGIKVCDDSGVSFHFQNFYKNVLRILKSKSYNFSKNKGFGKAILLPGISKTQYWDYQKEFFSSQRNLKLILEIGNGACYPIIPLLEEKNLYFRALHSEPDGSFPVMIPDPAKPKSLKYLVEEINKEKYDLGIGYDADGDRVGFVDEKARIIKPDQIIMIFGKYLLEKHPKPEFLIDIKTSKATYEYLSDLGAKVSFTRVGHSWIHEELLRRKAIFAGELSGHYYFGGEYYGFDDAIYSSLRMIEILASNDKSFSAIVDDLPSYPASDELRISCNNESKNRVVENIKKKLMAEATNCITLDGIRAEFEEGWVLVRASGTEPVLSVRAEGKTKNKLLEYYGYIKDLVEEEISKEKLHSE